MYFSDDNTRFANGVWNNLKIRDDVDQSLTLSIDHDTISQTGTNTNAGIFMKSKGAGSVIIDNETNNTLNIDGTNNKEGIGTSTPTQAAGSFFKLSNYAHIVINHGQSLNRWLIGNRSNGSFSIATSQIDTDYLTTNDDKINYI